MRPTSQMCVQCIVRAPSLGSKPGIRDSGLELGRHKHVINTAGMFGKRGNKPTIACDLLQPCDKMFKEMGLPIHSRTTDQEFKDIILTGTYKMRSKYDPPGEIYERVFAEVKHVSRLESLWLMKK